ncbi:hypothetical protein [Flavobacterium rhizosphaerae]|uniref:Uncharacterized protein n=1 Tax=Flavobacterium rhizosphaerae TaxID=3163298 RepID=A0ABW8YXN7_9FLAO
MKRTVRLLLVIFFSYAICISIAVAVKYFFKSNIFSSMILGATIGLAIAYSLTTKKQNNNV